MATMTLTRTGKNFVLYGDDSTSKWIERRYKKASAAQRSCERNGWQLLNLEEARFHSWLQNGGEIRLSVPVTEAPDALRDLSTYVGADFFICKSAELARLFWDMCGDHGLLPAVRIYDDSWAVECAARDAMKLTDKDAIAIADLEAAITRECVKPGSGKEIAPGYVVFLDHARPDGYTVSRRRDDDGWWIHEPISAHLAAEAIVQDIAAHS